MTTSILPLNNELPVELLLVEDEPNDRALFWIVATRMELKLRLHTVGHGQEAIEYLEGAGHFADRRLYPFPEVIVLDLRMPILDGFGFLARRRLSRALKRVPVMAVSGSVNEKWERSALALGADEYVRKPTRLPAWERLVCRAMELGWRSRCAAQLRKIAQGAPPTHEAA